MEGKVLCERVVFGCAADLRHQRLIMMVPVRDLHTGRRNRWAKAA